jgi:DNA-binding CsgD family transcriptional regulator
VRLREHLSNLPKHLKQALVSLEKDGLSASARVPRQDSDGHTAEPAHQNVRVRLDRPNHKLKGDEIQTLVESYLQGTAISQLALQFNLHEQTVRAHLVRAEVQIRPHRAVSREQLPEIVRLYESGLSLRQISMKLSLKYGSVRNYLLRAGVELRPAARPERQAASDS